MLLLLLLLLLLLDLSAISSRYAQSAFHLLKHHVRAACSPRALCVFTLQVRFERVVTPLHRHQSSNAYLQEIHQIVCSMGSVEAAL